jgi:2,4-dienoyl-CoA reductase-like NADH-dependent reductase (Old Yellow Enzyme family)
MSKLFSSISIGNIILKNRVVLSPICQYSSIDGFANDWHVVHLGSRAVGGSALILFIFMALRRAFSWPMQQEKLPAQYPGKRKNFCLP